LRRRRQFVERFGLDGQWQRLGFACQNRLIECRRVGLCAFDSSNHDLIVLALMFTGQRPHIDAAAVLR